MSQHNLNTVVTENYIQYKTNYKRLQAPSKDSLQKKVYSRNPGLETLQTQNSVQRKFAYYYCTSELNSNDKRLSIM